MLVVQKDFIQVQQDVSRAIRVHSQVPEAGGILGPSALCTRVEVNVGQSHGDGCYHMVCCSACSRAAVLRRGACVAASAPCARGPLLPTRRPRAEARAREREKCTLSSLKVLLSVLL